MSGQEELGAELATTIEKCKAFSVPLGNEEVHNPDALLQLLSRARSNNNDLNRMMLDFTLAQFKINSRLKETEGRYANLLADKEATIDNKVFRSADERKRQAELQLLGTPTREDLILLRHKSEATELLLKTVREAYMNLDKARHDIQTAVDLLKIKHGLTELVKT